jgi:hypothetical protein
MHRGFPEFFSPTLCAAVSHSDYTMVCIWRRLHALFDPDAISNRLFEHDAGKEPCRYVAPVHFIRFLRHKCVVPTSSLSASTGSRWGEASASLLRHTFDLNNFLTLSSHLPEGMVPGSRHRLYVAIVALQPHVCLAV